MCVRFLSCTVDLTIKVAGLRDVHVNVLAPKTQILSLRCQAGGSYRCIGDMIMVMFVIVIIVMITIMGKLVLNFLSLSITPSIPPPPTPFFFFSIFPSCLLPSFHNLSLLLY